MLSPLVVRDMLRALRAALSAWPGPPGSPARLELSMRISKTELPSPAMNTTLPDAAHIPGSWSPAQPIQSQVKNAILGHYIESAWPSGASYAASSM